jgi:GGDEF domain-containing protein
VDVEFVSNVYLVGKEKVIQCNIRDITERKQAQDALLKSQSLLPEQSVRDHLTGLFNRRYMEETLERELLRAARKQLSLGIIMLDLDNLKQFNDTWGHAAGDEFILILPDASQGVTSERAELICEHARQFHLQFEGQSLAAVTLSLGVAIFPEHGITSTGILRAVYAALYHAKHEGRDRMVVAGWKSQPGTL